MLHAAIGNAIAEIRIIATPISSSLPSAPTASLDAIAEQQIYDQFDALRRGKTTIFVSHRLSSATVADKIIVLMNGEIVEQGTHRELIELGGHYCELFTTQARRYLGDEAGTADDAAKEHNDSIRESGGMPPMDLGTHGGDMQPPHGEPPMGDRLPRRGAMPACGRRPSDGKFQAGDRRPPDRAMHGGCIPGGAGPMNGRPPHEAGPMNGEHMPDVGPMHGKNMPEAEPTGEKRPPDSASRGDAHKPPFPGGAE